MKPRKEKKTEQLGLPVRMIAFICGGAFFVLLACSGYLWNKNQIEALAAGIRTHEIQLEEAKRNRAGLERMYAHMCSREELDRQVKAKGLPMVSPSADQLVKLWEPGTAPAVTVVAQGEKGEGSN